MFQNSFCTRLIWIKREKFHNRWVFIQRHGNIQERKIRKLVFAARHSVASCWYMRLVYATPDSVPSFWWLLRHLRQLFVSLNFNFHISWMLERMKTDVDRLLLVLKMKKNLIVLIILFSLMLVNYLKKKLYSPYFIFYFL